MGVEQNVLEIKGSVKYPQPQKPSYLGLLSRFKLCLKGANVIEGRQCCPVLGFASHRLKDDVS